MAYDKEWARSILKKYLDSCTRARNLVNCVQQVALKNCQIDMTIYEIHEILIFCIRNKHRAKVWNQFKRLCKKSLLDKELLFQVVKSILEVGWEVDVEKTQRQFQWD